MIGNNADVRAECDGVREIWRSNGRFEDRHGDIGTHLTMSLLIGFGPSEARHGLRNPSRTGPARCSPCCLLLLRGKVFTVERDRRAFLAN